MQDATKTAVNQQATMVDKLTYGARNLTANATATTVALVKRWVGLGWRQSSPRYIPTRADPMHVDGNGSMTTDCYSVGVTSATATSLASTVSTLIGTNMTLDTTSRRVSSPHLSLPCSRHQKPSGSALHNRCVRLSRATACCRGH